MISHARLLIKRKPFSSLSSSTVSYGLGLRWNSTASSSPELDHTDEPAKTTLKGRGVKLPPRDQRFVILSAKDSSILPRNKHRKLSPKTTFKPNQIDAQLKRLLVFKAEVPEEVMLQSIEHLKPNVAMVSKKRYEQLFNDIQRAYSLPQLKQFLLTHTKRTRVSSKERKVDIVNYIISKHWNIKISKDIDESSDVIVENTIDLSRRDLFIIVSNNGQLPRYWSKSGAKIVILGDEQKIIIRSTADTFAWINASMMKVLNNVANRYLDLASLQPLVDTTNLPLDKIQRISNVYIEREPSKFILSSTSTNQIDQAERLILASTGLTPRQFDSYLVDVNKSNLEKGAFTRIIEEDALSWIDRDREWSRWRFIRRKIDKSDEPEEFDIADIFNTSSQKSVKLNNVPAPDTPEFKLLDVKSGSTQDITSTQDSKSVNQQYINSITDSILKQFDSLKQSNLFSTPRPEESNYAVAATFGNILYSDVSRKDNMTKVLKKDPSTSFLSNIPNITEFSRTLSLYSVPETDSVVETEGSEVVEEPLDEFSTDNIQLNKHKNDKEHLDLTETFFKDGRSPADAINTLFENPDEFSKEVKNSNLVSDEHTYFVQIKFLPSPFHPKGQPGVSNLSFETLPPLEMWIEVDESDRADTSTVNLMAVERESNTFTSIPQRNSDIKFSATESRAIDVNQESVAKYLARANLDFSGKSKIYSPNILEVSLDGSSEPFPYMYQSMFYRKQVDLNYKGQILQLASVEGGVIGGHRTEATMVLDSGNKNFNRDDVKTFVRDALDYLNDIQPHKMI